MADAHDSGSCGKPCRFKSCHPHQDTGSGSRALVLRPIFLCPRQCFARVVGRSTRKDSEGVRRQGQSARHVQTRMIQVLIFARKWRFKSSYPHQIRNSRLIQSYRPTVFFLSLKIDRKSLIYKGFFSFVVHFDMCGAYMLRLGCIKMQKSTTPRQGVVPSYR